MIISTAPKQTAIVALFGSLVAACGGGEPTDETTEAEIAASDVAVEETTADEASSATALAEVSAGSYDLEKGHASLLWKISHNGLSYYTARFTAFDATLNFDPADPAASTLSVTIDPTSVRTDHPDGDEWDTELATDEKFFNAGEYPEITFTSTDVTTTGDTTGLIIGDLNLLGTALPVTLDTTFNGVTTPPWYNGRDVIGFSATATIKRSEFGMDALIPNIGDEVNIIVEAEFLQSEG
ncbi:MAG: YceI family protein [Pseudomonadota bacterium]